MTAVNDSLIHKYFHTHIQHLADNIKDNKSTLFISPKMNTDFLVRYFINNVEMKHQLLGRYFADYIFVCLPTPHNWAFESFEMDLLQSLLASLPNIDVPDFATLFSILKRDEKYLVLFCDTDDIEYYKRLYSYKYYLGSRVLFIFSSRTEHNMSDDFGVIEIAASIEELIIKERLTEVGISLQDSEITEIVKLINGDIGHADEIIMRWLYQRLSLFSKSESTVTSNEMPKEIVAESTQQYESDTTVTVEPLRYEQSAFSLATHEGYETRQNEELVSVIQTEVIVEDSLVLPDTPDPIVEIIPEVTVPQSDEDIKKKNLIQPLISQQVSVQSSNSFNDLALTGREQLIYDALLQKKFLSRDEFAEIVWGDEAKIKSNPDAIDQIISRLRRKFVNAGYDKKYITSRKGEGIVIDES